MQWRPLPEYEDHYLSIIIIVTYNHAIGGQYHNSRTIPYKLLPIPSYSHAMKASIKVWGPFFIGYCQNPPIQQCNEGQYQNLRTILYRLLPIPTYSHAMRASIKVWGPFLIGYCQYPHTAMQWGPVSKSENHSLWVTANTPIQPCNEGQ